MINKIKNIEGDIILIISTAVMSFLVFGIIYTVVQQDLRQTANDPQIQIAEDGATALGGGTAIPNWSQSVDIGKSLNSFIIVYNEAGQPVASTGVLDGKVPTPPAGVLAAAKQSGENRITWQPRADVRLAAVVVYYSGKQSGYILSARSLKEVEKRESYTEYLASAGFLISLFIILAAFSLGRFVRKYKI